MKTKTKRSKKRYALTKKQIQRDQNSGMRGSGLWCGAPREFCNLEERSFRMHNKQALYYNVNILLNRYESYFYSFHDLHDEDYIQYKYDHRHNASWMYW